MAGLLFLHLERRPYETGIQDYHIRCHRHHQNRLHRSSELCLKTARNDKAIRLTYKFQQYFGFFMIQVEHEKKMSWKIRQNFVVNYDA